MNWSPHEHPLMVARIVFLFILLILVDLFTGFPFGRMAWSLTMALSTAATLRVGLRAGRLDERLPVAG